MSKTRQTDNKKLNTLLLFNKKIINNLTNICSSRILSPMTDSTSNFKHIFCHAPSGMLHQENWDLWPEYDLKSEEPESKSEEEEINDNKQGTVDSEENNKDVKEEDIIVNHIREEQSEEDIVSNLQEAAKECEENVFQENIVENHIIEEENEKKQTENNVKNEEAENEKVQENDAKIEESYIKDQIKLKIEVKNREMQESLANLVLEDETGDNADNKENNDRYLVKNVRISKSIAESEEDLNKYNFYQYWHVTPDLELDPQIVNSCGSPNKKNSVDQDFAVSIYCFKSDLKVVPNYIL